MWRVAGGSSHKRDRGDGNDTDRNALCKVTGRVEVASVTGERDSR